MPEKTNILPHDPLVPASVPEQKEDTVPDKGLRMPEPNFIQRKCSCCEEEEAQRKPITSFIQRKEMAQQQPSDPGKITTGITPGNFIQRAIRIDGGKQKINEKDYQTGGPKETVGSRFKVKDLLADQFRRVFNDTVELEQYANGATDYIGFVHIQRNYLWYRLPKNELTVLGEYHNSLDGKVEDIILGLETKRFMYEGFNEFEKIQPSDGSLGTGANTKAALLANEKEFKIAKLADYLKFNPDLENIVIKAFTGATLYKDFLGSKLHPDWRSKKDTSDYSYGDRTALYFSFAIHIASDIAGYTFPARKMDESKYLAFGRYLQDVYKSNKNILDAFSTRKDADKLIGIADMYKTFTAAEARVYKEFADIFEGFGAGYIEQLGVTIGNADLARDGEELLYEKKNLTSFHPAREEIMKEKIKMAKAHNYLLVGMGNAHQVDLTPWLDANKIPHAEVRESLAKQQADIAAQWVP